MLELRAEVAELQNRNAVNEKGLLPCPFCGGEITLWNYEFGTVKVFECKACRTRFIFPWDKDISEWNKRVSEDEKRYNDYIESEAMFDSMWGDQM